MRERSVTVGGSAPATLAVLRPLFRYSAGRDAYVLRIVGNRFGPVLEVASPGLPE